MGIFIENFQTQFRRWLILLFFAAPLLACGLPQSPAETVEPIPTDILTFPTTAPTETPSPPPTLWATLPAAAPLFDATPAPEPAAGPVFIGDGVSYNLDLNENNQLFFLDGVAGTTYLILAVPDSRLDPVITLADAAGSEIQSHDERPTGQAELLSFTPATTERFMLTLSGFENSAGSAQLFVAREGGSYLTPLLEVEAEAPQGEFVRHEVDLTRGRPVLIVVEAVGEFDPVFELYSPNGFELNRDAASDGEREEALIIPESDGEYALTVFGFKFTPGSYRLRVLQFNALN